jgi:hypothetical protein
MPHPLAAYPLLYIAGRGETHHFLPKAVEQQNRGSALASYLRQPLFSSHTMGYHIGQFNDCGRVPWDGQMDMGALIHAHIDTGMHAHTHTDTCIARTH